MADILPPCDYFGEFAEIHADHALLAPDCRDKVALLPHIGSGTTETRQAMADMVMHNLLGVLGLREEPGKESEMEAEL